MLGIWLLLSAFIWPHSPVSRTNTWVVGLIIAIVGMAGMLAPSVRWMNTAAGAWLLLSSIWFYPVMGVAAWNNSAVAAIVLVLSFVPNADKSRAS
jgi:hypothetical protein